MSKILGRSELSQEENPFSLKAREVNGKVCSMCQAPEGEHTLEFQFDTGQILCHLCSSTLNNFYRSMPVHAIEIGRPALQV